MSETKTGNGGDVKAITPVQAGTVARKEFGAEQLARPAETAAAAAAAQAQAVVQARYVVALQRPRDWDEVRVRLLAECRRPGFADVAWYRKPVGEGVEGFSIRFAEAAVRCMGNLLPEAPVIYDDPERRIVRVLVTDLESNVTYTKDVVVEKTVERRSLRKGQEALAVRVNSQGQPTYLVRATEDDMLAKEGAAVSKATRTLALRILPGDIADECKRLILEARRGEAVKDPAAARKKVADAFAELGVLPAALKAYLGHELASCSPAELEDLRAVWSAIKNGETTWAEVLAERGEDAAVDPDKKPAIDALTEKLKSQPEAPAEPKHTDIVDPRVCKHPQVPPSKIEALKPGFSIDCPDCHTRLMRERQPGDDDGDEAPATTQTPGPRPVAPGRQGRLRET